jgi:hypothetical protein
VLRLSNLLFKITILSAKLRDIMSLNTITRRFLTRQELQKCFMHDVHHTKKKITPEKSKNLVTGVIIKA